MAITYHSGRRIQGLERTGSTPSTEEVNFGSGYTYNASYFSATGSNGYTFTENASSIDQVMWKDLTTSVVGTQYVMRFPFTLTSFTGHTESANNHKQEIGLGSSYGTGEDVARDFMGLRYVLNQNTNTIQFLILAKDGSGTPNYALAYSVAYASVSTPLTHYIEIIRDGDTCKLKVYSDEYVTQVGSTASVTQTGVTGLQYYTHNLFTQTSNGVSNGSSAGYDIYDGVTSVVATAGDVKPTNIQTGSRFEETDTRKMYHRGMFTTPSLSKTDCVGYYTLDETSGNPANHVTTANGFTDIPTQTIYYLAHGHDATGRHFVKKVGSAVSVIDADDWFALKGALTEAHTGNSTSALPSAWSGMWQGSVGSINGHGWYAISFSTDTNSPVNGSTGATQNITGKHGKCFEFSGGSNEQVGLNGAMMADYYYPTQHSQTTHQADFAISCWINLSSNNTGYPSVISNYSGSNTSGFQFLLWGANTISFHTSTNAIHGSTVMSSGTWYHVVAMRESGYLKLYVNGSADGTPVANAHIIKAESDMVIGGKADGTAGFNGKIDDVSVWRRALTTSEISNLYSTGTVLTTGTSAMSWIEEGT